MVNPIESLPIIQFVRSRVIQIRSLVLIILNLLRKIFINIFVWNLNIQYYLMKFFGRYAQLVIDIITGNHYSLVNVSDDDFSIGTTAHQLFNQNNNQDYYNPNIHDIFHIYLSKLLYESSDQIKKQCIDWGFSRESIRVLTSQSDDMYHYPYSTQVAVIKHNELNRIIIAFRGTEPMDLVQWLTDAATNFNDINNIFNDNPIQVHAGFYHALGLRPFNPPHIDFGNVTPQSPMFLQVLNSLQEIHGNDKNKYKISITGHSLGAALASLFSFILLSCGYESSSIEGVYTYGQPLVGNLHYAQILNDKLGNRIHRWVNHSDIVPRIPVFELPPIAWYSTETPYSNAMETAANHNQTNLNRIGGRLYYHSGLRFKIDQKGYLKRQSLDQGPILAYGDRLDLFHIIYSILNGIHSLFNITPLRSFLWFTIPVEINDHFPGDYARKIKKIVNMHQITVE